MVNSKRIYVLTNICKKTKIYCVYESKKIGISTPNFRNISQIYIVLFTVNPTSMSHQRRRKTAASIFRIPQTQMKYV